MADKVRLTQPVGIRIEAARSAGLSDSELLDAVRQKDVEKLKDADAEGWNWEPLFDYGEKHETDFARAVRQGYTFSYLSIRGLKAFLRYRMKLVEGEHYDAGERYLDDVPIREEEAEGIIGFLPYSWKLVKLPGDQPVQHRRYRIEWLEAD